MTDTNKVPEAVTEDMPVAPPDPDSEASDKGAASAHQDAGADESITERLERNPESKEARLDRALDESMDASDPPSSTQPIHNNEPAPSSGYDADAETKRKNDAD